MTIHEKIIYRSARVEEILSLRHDVLIIGTNRTSPDFDGDMEETTDHFGAFLQERAICCLSLMRSEWEGSPAYQLRGMATLPEYRGQGAGKNLLDHAEQELKKKGVKQLWCNARTNAVSFYAKQGWQTVSSEFTIEGVGPHVKMWKQLI